MQFVLVALYLLAIVLANLIITVAGPALSIVTAFIFIGLDLTSRDKLHEYWQGKQLIARMGALILAGSIISYLLNSNSGQIAIASLIAFFVSALADALTFQVMHRLPWLARVNGSNFASALLDSLLFPTIAFGSFMPAIVLGQFLAKLGGGFIWSLILSAKPYAFNLLRWR